VNPAKIPELEKVLDKEILLDAYRFLVQVGEIPYQANRRALARLDLHNDEVRGLREVQAAVNGIDGWIGELELFIDATSRISKTASKVLRST
jgi:hypothetical protein